MFGFGKKELEKDLLYENIAEIKDMLNGQVARIDQSFDMINQLMKELNALEGRQVLLEAKMAEFASKRSEFPHEFIDVQEKVGRLWNLLTSTSPATGEQKLNKTGRRLGGKLHL